MEILKEINKSGELLETKLIRVTENLLFKPPESVGTIRLHSVCRDEDRAGGKYKALMDLGTGSWTEKNLWIGWLPPGVFKNNQIVEVIVRKHKLGEASGCLVAIRPFVKEVYGKFFGYEDYVNDVFSFNYKTPKMSPEFFRRFPM